MMCARLAVLLARLRRDERGAVSILTAVLVVVLLGFTGLALDIGSVVYWRHRLQSATDLAAMAAALDTSRASSIASQSLQANGPQGAVLQTTEIGDYVDDPSLSESARFSAAPGGNSVRLVARYAVPLHFIRLFTGNATMPVSATSTAYDLPLGGIAIGTAAADTDLADTNSYLDAVSGSSVQLTDEEQAALDATEISVFRLFDQIASRLGTQTMSIQSVMSSSVGLQTLAEASAEALTEEYPNPSSDVSTAIEAFTRLAAQSDDSSPVPVSDIVTLAAHQNRAAKDMVSTNTDSLGVPGYAILMDYLHSAKQGQFLTLDRQVTVPGVATISIEAVIAKGITGSGTGEAAMIGPVGSGAYGSRGRVQLTISLLQPIEIDLGLIQLSLPLTVPLIADIGYGTATVSDVSCGADILDTTNVAVSAQSGAVHLYIGSVNPDQLDDLLTPLSPQAAQIADVGVTQVNAAGEEDVAQSDESTLDFSEDDIENGTVKSIDGTDSLGYELGELGSKATITVPSAPPGANQLISNLVQARVASLLTSLAPEIDEILAGLGVRAGTMDVRATAARCGIPALAM